MRYIMRYVWAAYAGASYSVAGWHFYNWQFYVAFLPLCFLVAIAIDGARQ